MAIRWRDSSGLFRLRFAPLPLPWRYSVVGQQPPCGMTCSIAQSRPALSAPVWFPADDFLNQRHRQMRMPKRKASRCGSLPRSRGAARRGRCLVGRCSIKAKSTPLSHPLEQVTLQSPIRPENHCSSICSSLDFCIQIRKRPIFDTSQTSKISVFISIFISFPGAGRWIPSKIMGS